MQCTFCGQTLEAGSATCPVCGTPASQQNQSSEVSKAQGAAPHVEYTPAHATSTPTTPEGQHTDYMPAISITSTSQAPSLDLANVHTTETINAKDPSSSSPAQTKAAPEPETAREMPAAQQTVETIRTPNPPLHPLITFWHKRARITPGSLAIICLTCLLLVLGTNLITYSIVTQTTSSITQDPIAPIDPDPQGVYARATHGVPVIYDPLTSATTSQWPTNDSCTFASSSYHIKQSAPNRLFYCALFSTFKNFAFQAQMTLLSGDSGGLIFRADTLNQRYYFVNITADGQYQIFAHNTTSTQTWTIIQQGLMPAQIFSTGYGHSNTITIIARGALIYLYINKHYVIKMQDATFSSGQLALAADNKANASTEVSFQNAKIWSF